MTMRAVDLSSIDLLTLIGQDTTLRQAASTNGGEYCGTCPWCGGRDRFRVWPNHPSGKGRWWCRQCQLSGDAIDYIGQREPGLSWREKLERLGLPGGDPGPRSSSRPRPHKQLAPPGPAWQERARAFVEGCKVALWAPGGARALAWLRNRGLNDETIRAAGLGYNPSDRWDTWETWGLEPREGKRGVWLPRGIVIPWVISDELWRVNIRRPVGDPKYIGPAGFGNALYNTDALAPDKPAILVEGEIDVLTIGQVADDLVTPVATGSTSGARRIRWIAKLALCPMVLVAYDADDPGKKATAYWLDVLGNAKHWRPYWKDANAMAQDGADVRAWIAAGVGEVARRPTAAVTLPLTLEKEAEMLLARYDGGAKWAREWADLAEKAGWPCYADGYGRQIPWSQWAEDVLRQNPNATGHSGHRERCDVAFP